MNAPHLQDGPVLFGILGAIGLGFVIVGLVSLPVGSEPWKAGVLGLVIITAGVAFIELGWLWVQREITLSADAILIRRWIETVLGRSGRTILLGDETRASIVLENLRSLRIDRKGITVAALTLGYWERKAVRDLIDALRDNGIPLSQYWVGEYPPDLN